MLMTYFRIRRIENFTTSTARTGAPSKPARAHHLRPDTKPTRARADRRAALAHQAAVSISTILISVAFVRPAGVSAASTSLKKCLAGAADVLHAAVVAAMSKPRSEEHSKKRIAGGGGQVGRAA